MNETRRERNGSVCLNVYVDKNGSKIKHLVTKEREREELYFNYASNIIDQQCIQ